MAHDDDVWERLQTEAERLTAMSTDTVSVWAFRRGCMRVVEGPDAGDRWVYGLAEAVRWRWRWSSTWNDVQPAEAASSKLESFLRERPDL